MIKVEGKGREQKLVLIRTTTRHIGIVCLAGVLLLVTLGLIVPHNGFMAVWFGFLGLMALIFMWWIVRAHLIEAYVQNGVLHWTDEGSQADHETGSIPMSTIAGYRIVMHPAWGEMGDPPDVTLFLANGTEVDMPPNVAPSLAGDDFRRLLRKYNPEMKKPEIVMADC